MADPVDLSDLISPKAKSTPTGVDLSDLISGGPTPSDAVRRLQAPVATDLLQPTKPVGGRFGAAVRGATRGVFPAGTAAMGAATGAEVGSLGGPFDGVTIPLGALIGGGLGYWSGKKAQQSVMDNWIPQGALKAVGQDPASIRLDQQTYPLTSALSESAPSLVAGGALQRAMTNPTIVDQAMLTARPQASAPSPRTADVINATRAAADRQGVKLPTTLTSPTGYAVSRLMPGLGSGAIDRAEAAAPQAVGKRLQDMAQSYLKPTEPGEAGAAVQDAAARWAEQQRLTGGNLIDSAGTQAAGIQLPPTSTLDYIDKEIARLSTNPIANGAQIKMLSGLKGDLTNLDNPLDLNSLHDLRTSLYRNAVPEGLSASTAAKTRGELWTTLSDDIQGGLSKAADEGNTQAQSALTDFNTGTGVWKARQDALKSTLGKILGGDAELTDTQVGDTTQPLFVADKSPEAAASTINKLVGSDRRGVRTLMSTLDDDAKDTVRASVIASLGKDAQGEFSAPVFLKQMNAIPDVTRDALFGPDHAAALDDLQTVIKNIGQAQGRSHSWGSLGAEMAVPAMLGFATHGGAGAEAGVLATAGVNSTAAYFLSRPDTLKWAAKVAQAASSGDTAPVLSRLATAARSSPALASMYDSIQQTTDALKAQGSNGTKAAPAQPAFDPSKMSDEELGIGAVKAAPEHATLDPAAYSNKPLEELIPKVVQAESGGNPAAVSPKGAEGLFQAMPATQADPGFGVKPAADNSLAEKSRVGEDYLKAMIQRYGGNQVLALLAHNWGPGHVDEWVKNGMTGPVPKESRDYVHRILGEE